MIKRKRNKIRRRQYSEYEYTKILTDAEKYRLRDACWNSTMYLADLFGILSLSVIGLRIEEIAHLRREDVDFKKKIIRIADHHPCNCHYCQNRAKQMTISEFRNISDEEVKKIYWKPMTKHAVRDISYGFNQEYVHILEAFFDKYDRYPFNAAEMRRRIDNIFRRAQVKGHSSHDLRKTAAANFAAKGATEYELMAIMGWNDRTIPNGFFK